MVKLCIHIFTVCKKDQCTVNIKNQHLKEEKFISKMLLRFLISESHSSKLIFNLFDYKHVKNHFLFFSNTSPAIPTTPLVYELK